MPSWQYYGLLPAMHLTRLMTQVLATRSQRTWLRVTGMSTALADSSTRLPKTITTRAASVAGVPGVWMQPEGAGGDEAIIYLHGSGMVTRLAGPLKVVGARIAMSARRQLFAVDYRILPDTYPAAHDDCFNVLGELTATFASIVLVGDSSGGVLALASMLRAKTAGLRQPRLCVLLSPTVDYGPGLDGIFSARDPFLAPRWVARTHRAYIGNHDPALADLSPVAQDLSGLPPIHVIAGEHELLRVEVDRLVAAATRSGTSISVSYWPRMWHGWYVMADQLPEGRQALDDAGRIILGQPGASNPATPPSLR
ncbi:MAG TPA: alpha/beta hydrolase fold domain-containing protein [Candidatus Dormibacteraeota bacterium]|nr:alpha/beta hydrolase fold domain-containing protein [Candidatus Dormibacteraeota bacterium]